MAVIDQPRLLERGEKTLQTVPEPEAGGLALVIERLAANPNVDVTKLEKIIALQERILAHSAEAAFNAAFAEMQAEIPTVAERGRTDKGFYAELEDIIEAVRPVLQRYGFALSHRTEWPEKATVKIVGILTHREGHSRMSEFLSTADTSGSKNAIQALGSAVSYGRRYTTKDLLNIATRREDDDGRSAGTQVRQDIKAPDGFAGWWDDMQSAGDEGMAALTTAWNRSKPEYRKHLIQTNNAGWDAVKARAGKVGAK